MMFDEKLLEKTAKDLLKVLLVRLGVILLCIVALIVFKPTLIYAIFIVSIPLIILQIYMDKKVVIPKLITIFFWIAILMITHRFAGYYGVIGLVLFWVLYFAWRYYKASTNPSMEIGLDMIKNSRKYAEAMMNMKKCLRCNARVMNVRYLKVDGLYIEVCTECWRKANPLGGVDELQGNN